MQSLVEAFLIDRQSMGVTQKTLTHHTTSLKKFSIYLEEIGNPPLDSWTPHTLRGFVVHLQGQKLSPHSVRTYSNSVWAFVHWLYTEELIESNISEKARKPKLPKTQKEPFTHEEMKGLLTAAGSTTNGLRDTAIFSVLFDTGLRSQELCNLKVEDFYATEQLIRVRQGKGKKDRITPIGITTAKAINRYLLRVRGMNTPSHEPLFISKKKDHLTPNGVGLLVKRVAKEAKVENAHPHRFRHTSALFFLRNGGDPLTLQRILGHSTLDMTNKYVNMLSDDLSRVHAKASPLENLK